ncbi:hypothetical protein FB446DRAFT_844314 [Lentinula raphanica]|nr:hypothetical protein FB446DRAFT_844314 [Lentinula raphanica]
MSAPISGTFINLTFDDRDTTDLHYAGGWPQNAIWNASNVGETGTFSYSNNDSANVTFIFPTPANAVYYYGFQRCCGGLYAICVDCDTNNPIFEMIDAVNTTDDGKNPPTKHNQIILWSKNFDKPGIHEILLTNQEDFRFGGFSEITIDRFELQVPKSAPSLALTAASSSNIFSTSTASSPATASVQLTLASTPIIGAIVGTVAGVCSLIGLVTGVWVIFRRQQRRIPAADNALTQRAQMSADPFDVSVSTTTSNDASLRMPGRISGQLASESSQVRDEASSSSPPSSVVGHPVDRLHIDPQRETDAGQILDDFNNGETLPPDYDQIFLAGAPNSLIRRLPQPMMPTR